jgi:photosystem II stability/assembly factor-like uncharacterized protein/subtilisin-like proprotein convertase family protein
MNQFKYIISSILLFLSISIYPQSGWYWQNPLPQSNHLYDIESLSGLTIAVGSYGTILSSTGSGWQIRDAETKNALWSVSMKGIHAWVCGNEGIMLHCSDGVGYLWEKQTTGITNKQLLSVFFLNENYGWSVGNQETIIRTTNGGVDWQVIRDYTTSIHYFEVFFHDETNGWLCGASGLNGYLAQTTDGGQRWIKYAIPPSPRLYGLHFADTSFGCTVGTAGTIYRTTNGGADWSLSTSNTSRDLKSVYLKSNGEGWAVGYEGEIIHTNDYAATWNVQKSPTNSDLNSVYNGRAVGTGGTILRSTNEGINWVTSSSGYVNDITEIDFVTNNIGYASGTNGKFYRTFNGGDTWEQLSIGTSLDLFALNFLIYEDVTTSGYILGQANGEYFTVFRTTDAGDTWLDKSFTVPNVGIATHLYYCYRMLGKTYVTGRFGFIAKTEDAGNTWEVLKNNSQSFDLWTMDFANEYVGWVAGSSGTILKTTNKGEDWFSVNPDNLSHFKSIYFTDVKHGWAVGVGGVIYRTTDGGYNWTKTTPNVTYETLLSVYFTDQNNGWICGTGGLILHTSNGGVNWFSQESGTNNDLNSLSFTETGIGWISGWYGTILHTEDGGGFVNVLSHWRNSLNLSLADPGETTDEMNVVGIQKKVNSNSLAGVTVVLDTILHTNVTDLAILLSHNGVTDTLVLQPNTSGSNFIGCILTDANSVSVDVAQPSFTGIFKPHSPLSVFNGMDPNGVWTLKIIDLVSGNTGTLEAWGLKFYYANTTDVEYGGSDIPQEFNISQNYPNPFNPNTTIKWQMPKVGFVTLKVYDVLGREVTTLVSEELNAGKHETVFDASQLSSGVYFYQLKAGKYLRTMKMILLK